VRFGHLSLSPQPLEAPTRLAPEPDQEVRQRPAAPARIGCQHQPDGQLLGATTALQLDPVGTEGPVTS